MTFEDDEVVYVDGKRGTVAYTKGDSIRVNFDNGKPRSVRISEKIRRERAAPPPPTRVERIERDADRHVAAMQAVAARVPDAPLVRASELRAVPKRQPTRSAAYLAYVRSHPCCAPVCGSTHDVQASHHGSHGIATKPDDHRAIPLCRVCHIDEYHQKGALRGLTPEQTRALITLEAARLLVAYLIVEGREQLVLDALVDAVREESAHG